MKIIEGKKEILDRETTCHNDGIVEEYVQYRKLPDKKILERSDRFIVTKEATFITSKNHLFMVTTVGLNQHNIISVEHGNVYYGGPATTIEELSRWITEDFEDFNVINFTIDVSEKYTF
ncbi:hypothetical protein PSYJYH_000028 [Bacillus phage PSYJ-YH]|nr:hypothetical protein PSYJYH_000028 [Bacillus phage PSYJ-YH]